MTTTRTISVLLVDDHAVVRSGYRALLSAHPEISQVHEASSASSAYQSYRQHLPTVTIMDINMPGASGIEAVRRIVNLDASARILMFSMHDHPTLVRQALDAGALGLVTKDQNPDELVSATIDVARGVPVLNPAVACRMVFAGLDRANGIGAGARVTAGDGASAGAGVFERLSLRELEACRLLLNGHSIEQIALELKVTAKTVSNRLSCARHKLHVDTDIELARLALATGLVQWVRR